MHQNARCGPTLASSALSGAVTMNKFNRIAYSRALGKASALRHGVLGLRMGNDFNVVAAAGGW